MSEYRRLRVPGATVFFTVCLADRSSSLLVDQIEALRVAVRQTQVDRPFRIDAAVVLPDHLHMIWTLPDGDSDYSVRWGAIKARFSRDVRRAGFTPPPRLPKVTTGRFAGLNPGLRHAKGEVAVWQRRFWEHHVRGPEEYDEIRRYCWLNPVKHGYVERPEDWPLSSYRRDAAIKAGGVAG